jgi:hypothetical protein
MRGFLKGYSQCTTFTNVVQHLGDVGRFEINKPDVGPQREDRILLSNHLGVSQFIVWLQVQNAAQEIRENRGILNRVRLSWARRRRSEAYIVNDDVWSYVFTHNYTIFTLLFSE